MTMYERACVLKGGPLDGKYRNLEVPERALRDGVRVPCPDEPPWGVFATYKWKGRHTPEGRYILEHVAPKGIASVASKVVVGSHAKNAGVQWWEPRLQNDETPAEPLERVLTTEGTPRVHIHVVVTKGHGTWTVQVVTRIIARVELDTDNEALSNAFGVDVATSAEIVYEGNAEVAASRTMTARQLDELIASVQRRAWDYTLAQYHKDQEE